MVTFKVEVTQMVSVTLDETKFTPEFMEEFRRHMYPFATVEQHVEHLAQLHVRGLTTQFVEGYGELADFSMKFARKMVDVEVIERGASI